jgi:hypothetical protein
MVLVDIGTIKHLRLNNLSFKSLGDYRRFVNLTMVVEPQFVRVVVEETP